MNRLKPTLQKCEKFGTYFMEMQIRLKPTLQKCEKVGTHFMEMWTDWNLLQGNVKKGWNQLQGIVKRLEHTLRLMLYLFVL